MKKPKNIVKNIFPLYGLMFDEQKEPRKQYTASYVIFKNTLLFILESKNWNKKDLLKIEEISVKSFFNPMGN